MEDKRELDGNRISVEYPKDDGSRRGGGGAGGRGGAAAAAAAAAAVVPGPGVLHQIWRVFGIH